MNVVIFSNAPIKRITDALNLPFSPKEGWVSAAIAMLQTVECNIFYVFPQRKTKEVIKGKIENIQYYGCLLYTSPSPRDGLLSRMPSSA